MALKSSNSIVGAREGNEREGKERERGKTEESERELKEGKEKGERHTHYYTKTYTFSYKQYLLLYFLKRSNPIVWEREGKKRGEREIGRGKRGGEREYNREGGWVWRRSEEE